MTHNTKRWFSILAGSGLAVLLLVGLLAVAPAFAQGGGMMGNNGGGGMMGNNSSNSGGYGPGWMMGNTQGFTGTNRFGHGPGWMMGRTQGFTGTTGFGPSWMMRNFFNNENGFGFGPGWMMGRFFGSDTGFGPGGMMGGNMMVNPNNPFYTAPESLTMEQVSTTLDAYLADLNDGNLTYDDIMIFDNHAYAQIIEQDSGIGVLEVLIDPTTQAVYPEMGPNIMWNQQYGMMSGYGRFGMMRGFGFNQFGQNFDNAPAAEMSVAPEQAVTAAQGYLDANFSAAGLTADEHAEPFYGYYTLHVNRDGQPVGMLSVNGYSGEVWPHTWHGQLLEMSAE